MDMDLIQLQLEEKRLAIKKAKLEIELLEHRLKDMKKWNTLNKVILTNHVSKHSALWSARFNGCCSRSSSSGQVTCPIWSDPEPTQTLKPRLQSAYCHLHLGLCSAVRPVCPPASNHRSVL